MTDVVKKFIEYCDTDRRKISTLANNPEIINWVREETLSGISQEDEHYSYLGKDEFSKEIGSRLSYLYYLCPAATTIDLGAEDGFPLYAEAFFLGGEEYWIVTITGQGSSSWIYTHDKFMQEYGDKI